MLKMLLVESMVKAVWKHADFVSMMNVPVDVIGQVFDEAVIVTV